MVKSASTSTARPTPDVGGRHAGRRTGAGPEAGDSGRTVWLRRARAYLSAADPVLAGLIEARPDFDPRAWLTELPAMDLFGALVFQVTGQQPSVAEPGRLRAAGLSWRKIGTLRDLAGRLAGGRLDQAALSRLPDEELLAELTAIRGIGPWTVQGALIIALGRKDVVLPGDLALRKTVRAAYRLDHLPSPQEVLALADKWRPYRSLATSYLFSDAYQPAEVPPAARHRSAGT